MIYQIHQTFPLYMVASYTLKKEIDCLYLWQTLASYVIILVQKDTAIL